jgi:hypothetical protein
LSIVLPGTVALVGIMKRNLFIFLLICLLLIAVYLAVSFSNQSKKFQKASADTIDSLIQICSDYTQQIDTLRKEAALLHSETQKFELLLDSLEQQFAMQAQNKKQLIRQIQHIREKIRACEETQGDNERIERNCEDEIEKLKSQIALLHSRHDIPVIFLLYSSLQYYGSDSSKSLFFIEELDRIARINGWQVSCDRIVVRVSKSPKLKYRGLKWAGLKGGCPFEASYFLLEEYNYDPEKIDEEEFVEILKEVFHSLEKDFAFCSSHIKKSFYSEGETLKRIKDTITCLKQNLEIK